MRGEAALMMTLPSTQAGEHAAWLLDSFGTDVDDEQVRARFSNAFLEAVPVERVKLVIGSMAPAPTVTHVADGGRELVVTIELDDDKMTLRLAVDDQGQINGLLIQPATPTVAEVLRDPRPDDDVEGLFDQHLRAHAASLSERSGVAAAILHRGRAHVFSAGAVSRDSIFQIGSIAKPITATLLAELVSRGTVALDDPIDRWLDDVRLPRDENGSITLMELATHTSGLPRLPVNMPRADPLDPYKDLSVELLLEGLAETPLQARGRVAYSNLGYALLGQVLARAAGEPYEDLLRRLVFEPAGMTDASVGPDPASSARRLAGFDKDEQVPHWTMPAVAPAGGVEATTADLLAFARFHLDATEGSAPAMTQPRRAPMGEGTHMGLAWVIAESERGDFHWHNGGVGGFRSFMGFHRNSGTAIVALTNNSAGAGPDAPAAAILGAVAAAVRA